MSFNIFARMRAVRRWAHVTWAVLSLLPGMALAGVDLLVNHSDAPDPVAAGGGVTYTVRVTNDSFSTGATGVTTTHSVPASTSYQGFSGAGIACAGMSVGAAGPGTLTCTLPNLAANGGQAQFTLQLQTSVQGSVILGASAASNEVDDSPGNNSDPEQTTVNAGANLAMSLTPSSATLASGSTFSWALAVSNSGPDAATNLVVQTPVPTGFNVTSIPAGCTNSAGTITCSIAGPIASGGSVTLGNLTGQIAAAGGSTVTNTTTVTVSASAPPGTPQDPDSSNNTAIANITVTAGSDLAIAKTRSVAGNLLVGQAFSFELSPSYTGDAPSNLTVTDAVPANYTIGAVAASQNGWSCGVSGQTVTCTRPAGGVAGFNQALGLITIPVTVASAGNGVVNTASMGSASPIDPNPANNTASDGGVNLLNPTVNLGITKTGPNPALVVVGVPFTYSITANNTGTTSYSGTMTITDSLPAGLSVSSYTLNGWSCTPAAPVAGAVNIDCSRTYAPGAPLGVNATTPAIVLNATASATGSMNNSATITATTCNLGAGNCGDGDTANYSVTSSIANDSADIRLIKTVTGPDPVPAGDVLTYALEIVNDGSAASSSVVLTDTFATLINSSVGPAGAGYVGETVVAGVATGAACSTTAPNGTSRALTCTFTSIPVCTAGSNCPVVTVQVRPGGNGGNRTNTANAVSNGTADPDHGNDTASASSTVDPRADVTVTKTANPSPVAAGQNLTYVVTAQNAGPSQAANVSITDILPLDVTFVSATPSAGSCTTTPGANITTTAGNRTVACGLTSINSGAQRTVTIVVRPNTVTRGSTLANDVSVATTTIETNGGNNTASVNATVSNPGLDLVLNKTDSIDPVAVGDDTVYTITVSNSGPSAAENVAVTDTLPAGLSFQSITTSTGSCPVQPAVGAIGSSVTCNMGYVPAGSSISVNVTLRGVSKGVHTNQASVTSTETGLGFENAANNSVNETTTVRTKADMQVVSKIPSANPVNLRDDFNFVIRVRNNGGMGLAEADGVIVSDTLPANMELVGVPTVAIVSGSTTATSCTGNAGSTSFTCSLGEVSSGAVVDITVPVQLIAVSSYPQVFNNTASVSTTSLDINPANNSNSGDVTVNSSSVSGRVFRDVANDGAVSAGDTGIAGVTFTLTGASFDGAPVSRTATSDVSGNYTFVSLPQGTYGIVEGAIANPFLADGIDTAGSAGGSAAVNDTVSNIVLPSNTAASGYLFAEIPLPVIGIAKSAGPVVNHGDGTYSVPFTLRVTNAGETALTSVQVNDTLAGALPGFGTYTANPVPAAGEYRISVAPVVSAPVNGAALTAAAAGVYTGSSGGTGMLVPATSSLPNFGTGTASAATISFTVRFFPTTPGPFENTAVATGASPTGAVVTDNSINGAVPDDNGNGDPGDDASPTLVNLSGQAIGVAKSVSGIVQTGAKRYRIPYTIIVENVSTTVTATNVQVTDNLNATFPTAQGITLFSAPSVSACTGTVLNANAAFTGTGQTALLAGNQNLQPGDRCTITFTPEVDFGTNSLPAAVQNNQAAASTAQMPGGTVITTDTSDDGNVPDADGDDNANEGGENDPTPVSFAAGTLSAVTGKVYLDANHDRLDNDGAPATSRVQGFTVEVLNSAGTVVGAAISDANGDYSISGLYPSTSGSPSTYYTVRFREPVSGAIYGLAQSADPAPARNGTITDGVITGLQLAPGITTLNQNLPLDPSGVVYDAVTRNPVPGAQVTLLAAGVAVPGVCLVGGVNTQITGASGQYQFLLLNSAPPGCPGTAIYTLQVVQPGGYLPPDSVMIPPAAGPHVPPLGGVDAIQVQPGAPGGAAPTVYFTRFALTLSGVPGTSSSNVVNNHIPLDPVLGGAILLTKTTPLVNVGIGQLVPYTITARNTLAANLANIDIRDTVPPGFKYKPGSATVDGLAVEPLVNGRVLTWANLTFAANATHAIKLLLTVGAGVQPGEYVNTAQAFNNLVPLPNPNAVSNVATAVVRVTPDPTFDCSDLIGKVFDDQNANGYQDQDEPGIANVRLATARGWLVTADAEGRFHVACAAIPDAERGSNFIMKLDERTLPTGYRLTTENPRDVRLTRGKLTKLNFGATIHKVVRVDMSDAAFEAGVTTLKPDWAKQLAAMPVQLHARPSVLRLGYTAGADGEALARERLQAVSQQLKEMWKHKNCCHTLLIEEELFLPGKSSGREGK